MNRREFLKIPVVLTASYAIPYSFAWARQVKPRYLILVELNGGNDGLNTIIPFRNSLYYKFRPGIGLKEGEFIPLSDQFAMHRALEPIHRLWENQQVAIVNGVGYEDPNRSHFRSIEIWDTASDSHEYLDSGWLSRVIPGDVSHDDYLVDGIVIGRNAAPASGNGMRTLVMNTITDFTKQARLMEEKSKNTDNPALVHILGVQRDIKFAANELEKNLHAKNIKIPAFEAGPFGRQLQETAKLIVNGTAAPVIKVSIGSFDTHANQKGVHQRLLNQFAQGIHAFQNVMREHALWNDVMIMTYSEFGRRVKQNASQGTDHGTAAPHFFIGGRVKGGFYGEYPSLSDLNEGDLKYKVDYRSLYNTVAVNWWNSANSINVKSYPAFDLIS